MMVDASSFLNMGSAKAKDEVSLSFKEADTWLSSIINQRPEEAAKLKEFCEICGKKGKHKHHIAGEKHDDRTITVCNECHEELSFNQYMRDSRWLETDQPLNIRKAFLLWGLIDILELKARKTENPLYRQIAKKYKPQVQRQLQDKHG